ncbi:MAG: Gfo/Idh/MocA family oxidoreductase [Proteobacteria bacterium]|nr:Gfo/Idh/MocA family oxidoreductase [Pseudomonadota bacterium]
MKKLKVGVVGVGYFGSFHAEKYAKIPQVELVGVADINEARAQEVADNFSTRPYVDYKDLFDKIQAVSIAVPTPIHYEVARDFIDHGIDVLLEKPMTATLEQAEALVEVAENRERILQIGHLERFNSAVFALNGLLGDPLFIDSIRFSPFLERASNVDVVLDLMIHDIDLILSIVQSEVTSISAVGVQVISSYLDIANARVEFQNGCTANITASRVSDKKMRQIRIFQDNGYITIDFLSHRMRVHRKEKDSLGPKVVSEEITMPPTDALEGEIHSFIEKVRDRTDPLVSGRNGKRALEVALSITQQIQKNMGRRKDPDSLHVSKGE